jgi:Fe-S oxidoreductase
MAKNYLIRIMDVLRPAIESRTPMVVLEPSCWSVLRDEINELFPERQETHRIMENTFLLGEFLARNGDSKKLPKLRGDAIMHAHCHHKSIIKKAEHEEKLLKEMGVKMTELSDGCCGMAGSFGFEKEKYDVSVQVGEHELLPAVRKAGMRTLLIADGFSCREQISQLSNRNGLHFAEVLKLAMEHGNKLPDLRPESRFTAEHNAAVRRSKKKAALVLAGAGAAAGIGYWLAKKL